MRGEGAVASLLLIVRVRVLVRVGLAALRVRAGSAGVRLSFGGSSSTMAGLPPRKEIKLDEALHEQG